MDIISLREMFIDFFARFHMVCDRYTSYFDHFIFFQHNSPLSLQKKGKTKFPYFFSQKCLLFIFQLCSIQSVLCFTRAGNFQWTDDLIRSFYFSLGGLTSRDKEKWLTWQSSTSRQSSWGNKRHDSISTFILAHQHCTQHNRSLFWK